MIRRFERLVFGQYPQRGPGSGAHHPTYSMSLQKKRDDARRARESKARRDARRAAGIPDSGKEHFIQYAKQAHGLNQQQAEKQYQDVAWESYLAGQRNVGGRGGSAPGGGSSYNINTVSRTNATIKPVTVRSQSGGFPLMGGAVMAGAQQILGFGGGAPYVANSIFDRLDKKVGKTSHLNPTYKYFQSSVHGPQSLKPIKHAPSQPQSRARTKPTIKPTPSTTRAPTSSPNPATPAPKRAAATTTSPLMRDKRKALGAGGVGTGGGVKLGKRL